MSSDTTKDAAPALPRKTRKGAANFTAAEETPNLASNTAKVAGLKPSVRIAPGSGASTHPTG